ncbi:type VII secretion protein EccB [Streptomyces sp. V4I23]|uniref:type VII secretion protein EccB n=1 Tax=Streptomyces sp. V4I23 TaxID=3042282 RepID=UPI002783EEAE|nr:type VII secretion protein EccB [Streptomyces sp. V4I23]MDQ1005953.1 type VII secretion protein EccB [Streptomyces sp. V4I23]
MHSKRDQVQAHLFVMGRLASAMLRTEPDSPESPSGRTNRGAGIGVIIGVIICAGAFVFGLLRPGGQDSWKTSGDLIVDKSTGARYLYLDGRLRPVRNYPSARLIARDGLGTTTVVTSSLAGTPRGTPVGIPGAPEALPGPGDLDAVSPWLVCSATVLKSTGTSVASTALATGVDTQGMAGRRQLSSKEGLLVNGPDGVVHLLWQGTRLRLDKEARAVESLGYGSVTPRPVSAPFLNAFPQGPDLSPPTVPDRGKSGPTLAGRPTKIGQVFRVQAPGSAPRYNLLTAEGLVALTATDATLVLGDPLTRKEAYDGAAVTVATLGADALSAHVAPTDARAPEVRTKLPASPPAATEVDAGSLACAEVDSLGSKPRITAAVLPSGSLPALVQRPGPETEPACLAVDAIAARPDKGALVRAVSASGSGMGDTTFLVTDEGVKYRLLSQEAIEALGLEGGKTRTLPAQLLSMLPTGPDLSPEAASLGEARVTLRCE